MRIKRLIGNFLGMGILAGAFMLAPAANAAVFVGIAPPSIPVYVQPEAPGYGYIWTPGYWAYGPDGYYWVEGAWVLPPYEGALWTPGYWGWADNSYFWNPGYWGLTVGYYGGINYGFGYFGTGFYGGYWRGGHLFYNAEYNRFGFRGYNNFIYRQRYGGFDGRPGGLAFTRNVGRNFGGNNPNRGASINGRSFANTNRGPEQAGFRNGPVQNSRLGFGGFQNNNGQQARGGFGFSPQTRQNSGGSFSPQARQNNGGGFSPQSRTFSAPSAAPQSRGNFSASRPSFSGGGNSGGGARSSFGGGGNFGGGFRGGASAGGGGGSHGGGGGGRR